MKATNENKETLVGEYNEKLDSLSEAINQPTK